MAEAIKSRFDVDSQLIEGQGGVFIVQVDDAQIWDKKQVGRFPEHQEILDKIDAM